MRYVHYALCATRYARCGGDLQTMTWRTSSILKKPEHSTSANINANDHYALCDVNAVQLRCLPYVWWQKKRIEKVQPLVWRRTWFPCFFFSLFPCFLVSLFSCFLFPVSFFFCAPQSRSQLLPGWLVSERLACSSNVRNSIGGLAPRRKHYRGELSRLCWKRHLLSRLKGAGTPRNGSKFSQLHLLKENILVLTYLILFLIICWQSLYPVLSFSYLIGAPSAGNATLGTTHAFMRDCVPSFSFLLIGAPSAGNATLETHQAFMLCSLFYRKIDAHKRSHDCGWATVVILFTTAFWALIHYYHK